MNRNLSLPSGTGVGAGIKFSRAILVLAPVLVTFLLQLMIWPIIRPFAWFLFIPAIFLSAWIGGRWLGIIATVVATLLIWIFFLPPERSFALHSAGAIVEAITFLGMGVVFSFFHDRLKRANLRVAEALAANRYQAQLESVFQAIQDGIIVTDMEGDFLLVNEAEARMNGFPSAEAIKRNITFYQDLYELSYPDRKPLPFEEWPINKVLKGESITNLELRARRRDTGQERFFSLSGEPVRDEQGKQILAVVGTRDITVQKRAEELLHTSENLFRATFENAAVGIAHVAPDGRWLEVNQRFCDIVGYTREELMTKTFGDIIHPEDLDADWNQARRLLAGKIGNYSMEKRYYRKDGSIVWINLTASIVRKADGLPDYFIKVVEDISARKLAEAERAKFVALADQSQEFIGLCDLDFVPFYVNPAGQRLVGLDSLAQACSVRVQDYFFSEDQSYITNEFFPQVLRAGRAEVEIRLRHFQTGAALWMIYYVFQVRDENGQGVGYATVSQNITERKLAEEALRDREQRYELVLAGAGAAIWDWDVPAKRVVYSPLWKQMRGFEVDEVSDREEEWSSGIHPEDRERVLAAVKAHFDGRTPVFVEEYRVRHKSGRWIWILDRGIALRDPSGRIIRMAGSETDITERKRAEEALKVSELRFRTMVSAVPTITYETDLDGNNIFVSDQWCAYTGMTAEESAGAGFIQAYHPDEAEDVLAQWSAAVRSGMSFESKCRIRAADGSYRWFLNRSQPGRDENGRIIRWAGALTDIDDLIRTEEELRESKERLAGVVSSAMDAIITVDEDHRIVLFNEAAEKMFGCPAAEALGQSINRFIPDCFRGAHTEHVREFGETGGTDREMGRPNALTALRADGTEFPIEAAISSIEVGGHRLYTVIHRDITERKQAEAEREQLAQEQTARVAAEAANRSKDEFLAMVSHELRSPLTAILGYTRMLRSGPVDRDTINKGADIVERSAKAQLQIIEDLLDSARIITGKLRIELEPIDIVLVLETALDTVRPAAEAKGITLVANFGLAPEETLGDPTRLQQIVWNMLLNSIRFTPEGGRVELRMEGAADHIRITVSDTGKGIEPEFLPFVFDRLRQADASSTRRVGGLGLGLSLVKHLVELHGGTITATSEGAGRGATFTVTLPRRRLEFIEPPAPAVTPREVRTVDAIPRDQSLSLEGVSVLVVDDQEEARVVLTQTLSEYGAQVTAVSSGAEALALLSNLPGPPGGRLPDALILDIAMPEEDGYTVLKKVRALEAAQGAAVDQIPAIALTAYARTEDRLRALQAGFQMHVAKPVEPAELAIVIASVTARRERKVV